MGGLTRVMAGLLRRSARILPAGRCQWGEAAWAEAGEVPADEAAFVAELLGIAVEQHRLVWLVAREAG